MRLAHLSALGDGYWILQKKRPNYKLHPLILVKVQFRPLSFDRFNSVL
jgi:hypothetical protein